MKKLDIEHINKKLEKAYQGKVKASIREENHSIVVSGELDNWTDVVDACCMCVHKADGWHVVNHIIFTGATIPTMRMPLLNDESLEGDEPDVLVIGAGIVGCAIARELTRWDLDVLLVDKEVDVAVQASSRNDGQIHPGVDQKEMNIKLAYELRGNKMYSKVCEELEVPFERVGQYVAFKGKQFKPLLEIMAEQKRKLGIWDTEVIDKEELYKAVPNLNEGYDFALSNRSTGVVCPYGLTIAYAENAIMNGGRISLNTAVLDMELEEINPVSCQNAQPEAAGYKASFIQHHRIKSVKTNRGTIYPRLVINTAGVFSDKIAEMAGDEFFSIHPRRGTDVILDKKMGKLTDTIFSYRDIVVKGEKNTKGGGIIHTVDNNILIGPNAVETFERENYATDSEAIEWLFNKQKKSSALVDKKDIITYFTGVRAADFEEDFIVEKGRETSNLLHCAAIQSPGLTSAPALAEDVSKMAVEMLGNVGINENFNPRRKAIPRVKDLPEEERDKLIAHNPDYGVIVCRCEEVSKGEILEALRRPFCVPTLDGVKRRVRPGMGRCQGGFCGPLVTQIIAEFMQSELYEVTKSGNESYISYGETKGGVR